ncbi:MAG: hypothetical protein GY758_04205 [Fuerstiella sp.]|nr:hypothetical protein [Fuerstiella sp.]
MPEHMKRAECVHKKDYDAMRVEIEPGYLVTYGEPTPERREEALERWAREFEEFLKDHRSMDVNDVCVVVPIIDVCSECGEPWEVDRCDMNEDVEICAYCGIPTCP